MCLEEASERASERRLAGFSRRPFQPPSVACRVEGKGKGRRKRSNLGGDLIFLASLWHWFWRRGRTTDGVVYSLTLPREPLSLFGRTCQGVLRRVSLCFQSSTRSTFFACVAAASKEKRGWRWWAYFLESLARWHIGHSNLWCETPSLIWFLFITLLDHSSDKSLPLRECHFPSILNHLTFYH